MGCWIFTNNEMSDYGGKYGDGNHTGRILGKTRKTPQSIIT